MLPEIWLVGADEGPLLSIEPELVVLCAVAHVEKLDSSFALLHEILDAVVEGEALLPELDLARKGL